MDNKMKLVIEIKNKNPVELVDLARSMISLGDEYKRFIVKHDASYADADGVIAFSMHANLVEMASGCDCVIRVNHEVIADRR